jgi:hypothetical protein
LQKDACGTAEAVPLSKADFSVASIDFWRGGRILLKREENLKCCMGLLPLAME